MDGRTTPVDFIPSDSPIIDTDVYLILNEERRKWESVNIVDSLGVKTSTGLVSSSNYPKRKLEFPYRDLSVKLLIDECEYALLNFNSLNITGGYFNHDYLETHYKLPVSFDGKKDTWTVWEEVSTKRLSPVNQGWLVNKLLGTKKFKFSVPWYSEGNVLFEIDTTGAQNYLEKHCK